jgi:uridine kinase
MSPRPVSAAEAIAAARALPADRTRYVAIDGQGGAGKSTLAARMAREVPGCVVVHADDFASPSVPEWDFDRFRRQVLLPLLAGRPGRYQRWDWGTDTGAEWHDVPVGVALVLEGVSATRSEVAAPWDLTIWVDAPEDVRLARALERDGPELMATWRTVWVPEEQAYIARERPQERVDLIVAGTE